MSRFLAIIISMMYMVGGLVTGYYAYAYRIQTQAAEAGINLDGALAFVQTNYSWIGPILLVLATLMHLAQIFRARKVNATHVSTESELESNVAERNLVIGELEKKLDDNKEVMDFCRIAISKATAENILRDEESYAQPKDFPLLETDESN